MNPDGNDDFLNTEGRSIGENCESNGRNRPTEQAKTYLVEELVTCVVDALNINYKDKNIIERLIKTLIKKRLFDYQKTGSLMDNIVYAYFKEAMGYYTAEALGLSDIEPDKTHAPHAKLSSLWDELEKRLPKSKETL